MSNHALANVDGFIKRGGEIYLVDPRVLVDDQSKNIRDSYGDEDDLELKEWIRENGSTQLPPIDVQKREDNTLLVRDGYRRTWAMKQLIAEGVDLRKVYVKLVDKDMTDDEAIFFAFGRGQGKRPSPLEEARAFHRLKNYGHPVEEIALRVGKSIPFIYERLRLVKASPETREAIKNGQVNLTDAGKGISEAGADPVKQKRAIQKIVERKNIATIKWSKKSGNLFFEGFDDRHRQFVDMFLSKDLHEKLISMGLDPETLKITISKKGESNCQTNSNN